MSVFRIKIPYTPKAKASVRSGRYGHYNPSARGMQRVSEFVRKHVSKTPLLTGALFVICHFQLPLPKGVKWAKRFRQHLFPHTKKPDGDNLEKFLNDALNGIVWEDDARIAWLLRSKTLTAESEGSVTIIVQEIPKDKPDYELLINTIKEHIYIEVTYENE